MIVSATTATMIAALIAAGIEGGVTKIQSLIITTTICVCVLTLVLVVTSRTKRTGTQISAMHEVVSRASEVINAVNDAVNHVKPGEGSIYERVAVTEERTMRLHDTTVGIKADVIQINRKQDAFAEDLHDIKEDLGKATAERAQLIDKLLRFDTWIEQHATGGLFERGEDQVT